MACEFLGGFFAGKLFDSSHLVVLPSTRSGIGSVGARSVDRLDQLSKSTESPESIDLGRSSKSGNLGKVGKPSKPSKSGQSGGSGGMGNMDKSVVCSVTKDSCVEDVYTKDASREQSSRAIDFKLLRSKNLRYLKLGKNADSRTIDAIVGMFIRYLVSQEVKLVCFDFDGTMVDPIYTQEFFKPKNIANRVTPLFQRLVNAMLGNEIDVAIVTFNLNPCLQPAIKKCMNLPITVFARDDSRLGTGKLWHLKSAMSAYEEFFKTSIKPRNVVLFDDDPVNVEIAIGMGFNCVHNKTVIKPEDLVGYMSMGLDEGTITQPGPGTMTDGAGDDAGTDDEDADE
jgi:hypothetical protein